MHLSTTIELPMLVAVDITLADSNFNLTTLVVT